MSKPVIEVENISKLYRLGAIGASTLRESFERLLARWNPKTNGGPPVPVQSRRIPAARRGATANTFWALRDISFKVNPGEIVGVVGENGGGKSTLLKILSRITEPTTGSAVLRGRVGSLLEVGTGFHPELSGRDNIYLNGAMLGMKRAEIARKFDEIVAFSEIEDFVDTPVKRYSSGMYVRLAFAVAAHLEPEILLVDEVLAVGDAAFQKKCLGKMDDVARHGRTILLVSHNTASILSLCRRVVRLEAGRIVADGPAQPVMAEYLKAGRVDTTIPLHTREDRDGDGSTRLVALKIENEDGPDPISSGSRLRITIDYCGPKPLRHPKFVLSIHDYADTGIYALDSDATGGLPDTLPAEGRVVCTTERINLTPGRCFINIRLSKGGALVDYIQQAGIFDVEADGSHAAGKLPTRDWVLCLLDNQWKVEAA